MSYAGMVGANLEQMAAMSREFLNQSQVVEQLVSVLDGHVANTAWQGPNADRFRQAWGPFKKSLFDLRQLLDETHAGVSTNAANIARATGAAAL